MQQSVACDFDPDWWTSGAAVDPTAIRTTALNIRVANLRAETNPILSAPPSPENHERVLQLLNKAHRLEAEFVKWTKEVPQTWKCRTVMKILEMQGDVADAQAFFGNVDAYHD